MMQQKITRIVVISGLIFSRSAIGMFKHISKNNKKYFSILQSQKKMQEFAMNEFIKDKGNTLLHESIYRGDQDKINFHLMYLNKQKFMDKAALNDLGMTPLHMVVACKDPELRIKIASELLKRGCDITAEDKAGNTPLHWAAFFGDDVLVKFLLEHGARVNFYPRVSPYHLAYEQGHESIAKLLNLVGNKDRNLLDFLKESEEYEPEIKNILLKRRSAQNDAYERLKLEINRIFLKAGFTVIVFGGIVGFLLSVSK